MSYQVIARKWRPQDFNAIVFQDHISRTLKNSIKNGRVSHAYLFSGPRGVGKTTMARVLAKALNCVEGPTDSPCGVCRNCTEIRDGSSFDVIEIDGASNRGIDNIRELRENVNFAPAGSRYKVYIVDEVHMLTEQAFNALLKTLEEPPPHVVFIFATTEYHKIPETILSRCQKYFFKKLSIEAIVGHLSHIVKKEGFTIEEKALYSIARAADGSMRDAQSLLDQMLAFSDGDVKDEDALAMLGVVPLDSYLGMLGHIGRHDRAEVIGEIHRVQEMGVDLPRYFAGFMNIIRSVRMVKCGVVMKDVLGYSDEEIAAMAGLADGFHDEDLAGIYRVGADLREELRFTASERVAAEMALLDMVSVVSTPSVAAILRRIEGPAEGAGGRPDEKKKLKKAPEREAAPADRATAPAAGTPPPAPVRENGGLDLCWSGLMSVLQQGRQYLYFRLNEASASFGENEVVLKYERAAENGYYSRILDKKDVDFIKDELRKRAGRPIGLRIITPAGEDVKDGRNGPGEVPPPEAEMLKNPEVEEMKIVNPVVEKIKDMFHGQIVDKGDE